MARWLLLVLLLTVGRAMADPLTEAQARFAALQSYQVTLQTTGADGERQVIRYAYRKPGWVRMEFVQPHPGAVLVYDPAAQRVRVWPLGLRWSFKISLAPEHPMVRGPKGQRVDRSDVGVLLARLQALRAHGAAAPLGETAIGGRPALGLDVSGAPDEPRFRVWLARDTLFPLRVERFQADGVREELVDMADAQIDLPFPERFFTP